MAVSCVAEMAVLLRGDAEYEQESYLRKIKNIQPRPKLDVLIKKVYLLQVKLVFRLNLFPTYNYLL